MHHTDRVKILETKDRNGFVIVHQCHDGPILQFHYISSKQALAHLSCLRKQVLLYITCSFLGFESNQNKPNPRMKVDKKRVFHHERRDWLFGPT